MKTLPPAAAGELEALCGRHGLEGCERERLAGLLLHLATAQWAPTAVRDPSRAVGVHLADSLAALEVAELREAAAIADVGSGAGFPGLPLAVAMPQAELSLLEAQERKCRFIESARVAAGIGNARAVSVRAEEWARGLGAQDAVVARAVGPAPVVLEYAAPLLRVGGALVDWRGRRDEREERAATAAARVLGMRLSRICRMEPRADASEHHLHVYVKLAATPARFPRRPGTARKRPLGC